MTESSNMVTALVSMTLARGRGRIGAAA